MAQVEESGRGGRTTNVDVNLIPFIDLMSVLITFLLITAVWTQVSMIQLGSSIYGKKTTDQVVPPPPSTADIALRLDVKNAGFRLVVGTEKFTFPKVGNEWDVTELNKRLALIRNNYKDKSDATITVDNEVPYDKLIMGMDTLLQAGFVSVSVATTESED